MLLRKRPRGSVRRTNSMTGMTVDLGEAEAEAVAPLSLDSHLHPTILTNNNNSDNSIDAQPRQSSVMLETSSAYEYDHRTMAALSPRYPAVDSAGGSGNYQHFELAYFLRSCGLCKRRLGPGRDIYMYMGDTAFCSLECREQQMKQDERKEKCFVNALASKKADAHHRSHSSQPAASAEPSGKNETVAAA